jgi:hypothetical protein
MEFFKAHLLDGVMLSEEILIYRKLMARPHAVANRALATPVRSFELHAVLVLL